MYIILSVITSSFTDSSANKPFKLDVSEFPKVKLVNITNEKQTLLYDELMQPYVLRIFNQKGIEIESFDSRSTMKYDNTIRKNMFQDISPNESISLPQTIITKVSNDYLIEANAFQFKSLEPGTYNAVIEWTSAIDIYFDEQTSQNIKKDVWMGSVVSDKITFTLE